MRKAKGRARLLAVLWFVGILTLVGCATEEEQYTAAVSLYDTAEYGAAAKAFGKLGEYRDSVEWREKCLLLDSWHHEEAAGKFLDEYKHYIVGQRTAAFTMTITDRQNLSNADMFFGWAMDYARSREMRRFLYRSTRFWMRR